MLVIRPFECRRLVLLEHPAQILSKVAEPGGDLCVIHSCGADHADETLHAVADVELRHDDGMQGLIGVVGPTRMDYAQITARLSYFAENLSRMFQKNQTPAIEGPENKHNDPEA